MAEIDLEQYLCAALAQLDEPVTVPAGALLEGYNVRLKLCDDAAFSIRVAVADEVDD